MQKITRGILSKQQEEQCLLCEEAGVIIFCETKKEHSDSYDECIKIERGRIKIERSAALQRRLRR
jgi:hypothetical protein